METARLMNQVDLQEALEVGPFLDSGKGKGRPLPAAFEGKRNPYSTEQYVTDSNRRMG